MRNHRVMSESVRKSLAKLRAEYLRAALDERSAPSDPMEFFATWFAAAIKAKLPEPNAAILATATVDGTPSARAVLTKDFGGCGFLFFSNYESRKGRDLASNPRAALTFLWCDLERQVRIEGTAKRCSREESVSYFQSRPLGSQLAAIASPQSEAIPSRAWLEARLQEVQAQAGRAPLSPPQHWGGYWLTPHRLEFWQGRENRLHDRIEYRREGESWLVSRLAP